MKRKTFILTFLMMMFCSLSFGQNYQPKWTLKDGHQFADHLDMYAVVQIDGSMQTSEAIELAAFCGAEVRGSVMLKYEAVLDKTLAYLSIYANSDSDQISFKVYDHENGKEYCNVLSSFVYGQYNNDTEDGTIGDVLDPKVINFKSVASLNGVIFDNLQAAIDAAQVDETVVILNDATGAGVVIDKNVTIDFGDFTYSFNEGVGSAGTKTLGMQILQGNTVTLKNGKLEVAEGCGELFGILVQNYANLTVEDMTLDGDRLDRNDYSYVLSNNSGKVNVIGATNIYANTTEGENHFAFDVCKYANYTEPVVNVHTEGTITGAIEVTTTAQTNLNISAGTFTTPIQEAWCAEGYIPVDNGDGTYTVKVGSYVARNTTTGQGYETLVEAVEKANANDEVKLIADAAGAGLKINKNITVDFGGNTYTINQAVGSQGTESQGFQLLKNNNVTLKSGTVAVAENTNVKWMFNAYANLTLDGITVNCANMATPAEGEENYVLVANNGGGATPTITYSNVTINGFSGNPLYLDPSTKLIADAGLNIETIPGYKVVYDDGTKTYSVEQLRAYFKDGAYARYAANKPREHFSITIYDIYAENSLVVKVYNNETLLLTTTYRNEDLDVPGVNRYPVLADKLTVNNVVSGKVAGSWLNEWAVSPNVENVPNKFEVYVDGTLTNTYDATQNANAGFSSIENLNTYLAFEGVYKQASITNDNGTTYYMTFDAALEAAQSTDVITILNTVVLSEDETIDFANKQVVSTENPAFRVIADVTVKNGNMNTKDGGYNFILGASDGSVGNLTIESGKYHGSTSVASVTKGTLTIKGGEFSVEPYQGNYAYLINCIDANYKDGSAKVVIESGTFHNWNPQDNAAEGANTNFCAENYAATETSANVWEVKKAVAKIGETLYATLQDAVNAATSEVTVTLLDNTTGAGVVIDKNVTIDFGDFTYSFNEGVGSAGTKTLGMQILQGNTVTLKNGKLEVAEGCGELFGILVQNYANLTVEDMTLDGDRLDRNDYSYVLSNNSGEVNVIGATNIYANTTEGENHFAFDVCKYASYTEPVVNVNTTGTITGAIEVTTTEQTNLNISAGKFTQQLIKDWCAEGFVPVKDGEYWTVVKGAIEVTYKDGSVAYFSKMIEAVPYNNNTALEGATIKLLADCEGKGMRFWQNGMTFDLNGFKYTINAATGSPNTESQGFQIRPEVTETVTIKNGTIDIASKEANVKWMFNNYAANFVVENVTLECANMVTNTNEDNLLVVQNDGDKATFTNVKINDYDAKKVYLTPGATFVAPEGFVVTTKEGYQVKYSNGTYSVEACNVLNTNTGVKYATMAEAVSAAAAGNTIQLLNDITEDVTISKSLTIDGAGKNYTGTMTGNAGLTVTVQNLNYVNAGFVKNTKSTTGTYTFKDCTFDGKNNSYAYSLSFKGANKVIVENCSVKNYLYSFLYIRSSTTNVNVKNVTVDNCPNYAVYFASGVTNATFENLTVKNSNNGFIINNTENRNFTIKNYKLENVRTAIDHTNGTNTITCYLSGNENNFDISDLSEYAKIVLTEAEATLTAPEDFNVTTNVDGYIVDYADGKYYLRVPNYVAQIGEVKYESLQAAIDAAKDGDEIVVLTDIYLTDNDCVTLDGEFNTYFKVEGKTVTVNLNDKNIYADYTSDVMLVGVFSTDNGGHLTLKDSGDEGGVDAQSNGKIYSLIANYESGCSITIENGTYVLDKALDSHLYTGGDEGIIVNGGTFKLGNVGTGANGKPWIFNALGQNQCNVVVNGGTFNADVNHQFWANEVFVPETKALQNNGDGTWTVVESVAYVTEKVTSSHGLDRKVGYATFNEALASTRGNEVAVLTPVVVEEDMTIDLNGKNITTNGDVYPVIRIQNGANVTVKNGNITNNDYVFVLGASDGTSAGNLTIESGKYHGATSVASVTKGALTIEGGEFSVEPYQGNYAYLINCIDANFNDGSAKVSISGGKFHNWNPESNAAEGANTNFCAEGYMAVKDGDIYEVVEIKEQTQTLSAGWNWFSSYIDINGEAGLEKLQTALGTNGMLIKSQTQFTQYDSGSGMWLSLSDNALVSTSVSEMYMIQMSNNHEMSLTGNIVDPSQNAIELHQGWNWIGYPLNDDYSISDVMPATVPQQGDQIKSHLEGFAEYVIHEGVGYWFGGLSTLKAGQGYMYYRNGNADEFTYSYPEGSKSEARANVTAENNFWVPVSSQYANNMTITAMLSIDGEMVKDNYEIAAFVGGEVRGSARAIYVEPFDAYMFFLTVHGENVEEMTFKCYDLTTGEELELNNRVNYSNDAVIGSIREPYMLNYGTLSVDEMSSNTISIYPNPTTTGREINLEATCDTVEVFNALGVKIAEYQNVDTIDAIETAGIYVIRITNNGNVQNCRLVVK